MISFGFKYGIPVDADFVADMRFLPNPFWVPELRPQTGRDAPVSRLRRWPSRARPTFLDAVRPGARDRGRAATSREGKRFMTVADRLHRRQAPQRGDDRGDRGPAAQAPGYDARAAHRDLGRE